MSLYCADDGCLRRNQLAVWKAKLALSQPDIQFYDWEGWNDMEHVRSLHCSIVSNFEF